MDPIQEITGTTPLHLAAEHGHMEVLRILLEHKADKDKSSPHGLTPLRLAALNGHTEVVKLLLEVAWMKLLGEGLMKLLGEGLMKPTEKRRCMYRLSEIQGRHEIIFPVFFWVGMEVDAKVCIVWVGNVIEPENVRKLQKDRNLLFDSDLWSGSIFNFGCVAEFLFCTIFVFLLHKLSMG